MAHAIIEINSREDLISHNKPDKDSAPATLTIETYPDIDSAILDLEVVMSGIKSVKDFDKIHKRNDPVRDSKKYRQKVVGSLSNEELHNTIMNVYRLENFLRDYKEDVTKEMKNRLLHNPESITLDLRHNFISNILEGTVME